MESGINSSTHLSIYWNLVANRGSSLFSLPFTPIFQVVVGDGFSLFWTLIQTHFTDSVIEVDLKVQILKSRSTVLHNTWRHDFVANDHLLHQEIFCPKTKGTSFLFELLIEI